MRSGTEMLHQTMISAGAIRMPLFFFADGPGLDIKLGVARGNEVFNDGNLDTLLKRIGFRLDPVPPSAQELPLARTLIATAPAEKPLLTREEMSFLENAM